MTDHFHHYQRQLDRARQHVARCRSELERFDRRADPFDIMAGKARDRLAEDLRQAEISAGWCELALADVSAPMEAA